MKSKAIKAALFTFGLFWLCYLVAFMLTCLIQGEWSARMLVHWQTGAFTLLLILTAVVRVMAEKWHGVGFVDHHSLVKTDKGWKIVAKIYHTL